jgi:pimeloyl-ACP methyl ester carboxylesterase
MTEKRKQYEISCIRSERWVLNGSCLHVRIAGGGPLVVLLHGWSQTSYLWRRVIPLLVGRYTVVAPDLRGVGDSDPPDGGYDKDAVAADIAALIEHTNLGAARVAGHDWGDAVGYLLAATHPHLVTHFAAMETVLPGYGLAELADVRHGPGTHRRRRRCGLGVRQSQGEPRAGGDCTFGVVVKRRRHGRVGNQRESPFVAADQLRQQFSAQSSPVARRPVDDDSRPGGRCCLHRVTAVGSTTSSDVRLQ